MRNDKLIPGLILVLIGAAILLVNYGYLDLHWENIFRLWPIFLIIGGVNLVFANNKSPWATIVKLAVLIGGLGLLFFGNLGNRYNFWPGFHYSYRSSDDNDDRDDDDVKMTGNGTLNESYRTDIKTVRLNISGGGTAYDLSDTTSQLFSASARDGKSDKYSLAHRMDDSVYVLDFRMKNSRGFHFGSKNNNNGAELFLNPNPEWEINVESGAAKIDFDLSKFKIRKLELNGGFEKLKMKLGTPLAMTNVEVATGFSDVDVSIPQDAACSIETNSAISGNHFDGFIKTDDNHYETAGYSTSKNKIHIHMSGGLSNFHVRRY